MPSSWTCIDAHVLHQRAAAERPLRLGVAHPGARGAGGARTQRGRHRAVGPAAITATRRSRRPAQRRACELRSDAAGGLVGGPSPGLGVGDGEIRAERDGRDVGDAGPVQPVLEVGLLEVAAERRRATLAVDGARVDDDRPATVEETGVPGFRVESNTMPGWLTTSMNCFAM